MARLLDCGREAAAERGPEQTRVDDVVGRAGTSHGTFYLYFENIDDLLNAVVAECDAEYGSLITELRAQDASDIDRVARSVSRFDDLYQRYGVLASPWARPGADDRIETLLQRIGGSNMSTDAYMHSLALLALIDRLASANTPGTPELRHRGLAQLIALLLNGRRIDA